MRTSLIVIIVAASILAACTKSPSSSVAAKSEDPVTRKLQELAGSGATDCGHVKSQDPAQIKSASDCAMTSAKDKKAFYIAYDIPGLTVGVAGDSQGKLSWLQAETPENAPPNPKVDVKASPCPAELRVAQSGRVTCMTPGAGMNMGGTSPHGGMPPASGENPHAGAITTKPGAANPHAAPSHDSGKTPPKQ